MTSLDGYVAAVTGASSGIGAATARALVAKGAKVVLGARRHQRLEELVRELGTDNAISLEMDVRLPQAADELVNAAISNFGKVDGLIANAGIGMYGGILEHSNEELATMLDTNIAGTVWPVRAAVRHMLEREQGDVIIVSSVAGLSSAANEAVYAATKHAQMGLTKGLDREVHRKNIRVTAMCPGGVVTEFAMADGAGRTPESPQLADMMQSGDVANAIVGVLEQPRHMRTLMYSMRGATEEN